ncbi:MAG: DUF4139 domain-containing protein [Proteobacteria bacterium]|nr:DUF4139 domain-containing protein [Pseudomonadota bacterium]
MCKWAIFIAVLFTAGAATAANQQLTITVYNNNLALVQDVRHLDVPSGRARLELKNVSAGIKPETVTFAGAGLSIVEQNFDYDLLTPAKMMEKAVGRQIQIVRTNPATGKQATETATVLSVNDGVILQIGNHIEVLRDDGIPTRVVFSSIPENLRPQPTLSVTVDAAVAGPRDVTLNYLTTGLSWKPDYVALYDENLHTLSVAGWITLINRSGTSFKDVRTQLVAGDIDLADNATDYWNRDARLRATQAAGTGASGNTSIADYELFALTEPVTIANNQTKQVAFLDAKAIRTEKAYEYRADQLSGLSQPAHVGVLLKFANTARAMPGGVMRVYMRDAKGEPKFVGEDTIGNTPAGTSLAVKLGDAFDVTVQPTLVDSAEVADKRTRYTMSYVFRNAREAAVTVALRQGGLGRGNTIVTESLAGTEIDAFSRSWSVAVPAHGEAVLTFTVDMDS